MCWKLFCRSSFHISFLSYTDCPKKNLLYFAKLCFNECLKSKYLSIDTLYVAKLSYDRFSELFIINWKTMLCNYKRTHYIYISFSMVLMSMLLMTPVTHPYTKQPTQEERYADNFFICYSLLSCSQLFSFYWSSNMQN